MMSKSEGTPMNVKMKLHHWLSQVGDMHSLGHPNIHTFCFIPYY